MPLLEHNKHSTIPSRVVASQYGGTWHVYLLGALPPSRDPGNRWTVRRSHSERGISRPASHRPPPPSPPPPSPCLLSPEGISPSPSASAPPASSARPIGSPRRRIHWHCRHDLTKIASVHGHPTQCARVVLWPAPTWAHGSPPQRVRRPPTINFFMVTRCSARGSKARQTANHRARGRVMKQADVSEMLMQFDVGERDETKPQRPLCLRDLVECL